jgi:outer membrane protein insertion porin family
VLQLGFKFNNFSAQNLFDGSAWRPLPSGDGQKLGVNVRTNGSYFQSYSLSFTEPWFRGKPNPVGGSVSYSRFSRFPQRDFRTGGIRTRGDAGTYTRISSEIFSERRLQWPDDKFNWSTALGYQYYNNAPDAETGNTLIRYLPRGVSQQVTVRQALTRNSLDNPLFPSSGSKLQLSVEVAPPLGDLVQYHKWRFKTNWNVPMGSKFSIGVSTDYGYIGSLTGEDVRFQRFELGGSPFDYGGYNYGTDPVFMRGYPARTLGPRERRGGDFQSVGGRILNKYTTEFRWKAVSSQQLQAAPYLFLDAGNTWDSFQTFNPSELYRSAGVGVKLFLPIVGMIEFNYGYNFDAFNPLEQGETGEPGWRFQFSLGQGFGN